MPPWSLDSGLLARDVPGSTGWNAALSRSFNPVYPRAQDIFHSADVDSILTTSGIGDADITAFTSVDYEYIVVGGGTSGLALASKLAEGLESDQYVAVIEAGLFREDGVVDVPGAYGVAIGDKDYDWTYQTVPQSNLNNRQLPEAAGRLLGGSSGMNLLLRMRASSPEYDAWSEFGDGWDWSSLLPYFKSEENYTAYVWGTDQIFPGITLEEDEEARREEPEFRGHSGPVYSTHNDIYTDLMKPTIETTLEVGIRTNRSPNYGNSTGMYNTDTAVNRQTGTRSYAANAYLRNPKSVLPQPNVVVLTGVYASKILFDTTTADAAKAVGLTCLKGVDWKFLPSPVTSFDLKVKKEIIVSGGCYNTPQLLELSGVGNSTILSQLGIPTVVDLPSVGENLQQHPYVASSFAVNPGVFTFDRLRTDPNYQAQQVKQYQENRTGAYATTISALGYFKLENFLTEAEVNELKTDLDNAVSSATNPLYKKQLEIQRQYLDNSGVGNIELIMVPKMFGATPQANTSYISFLVTIPHPVARGSVHISSSNPLTAPSINPRYLDNPYDFKILTKATQFVRTLSQTSPLKDIIAAPYSPGPQIQTDADFQNFTRNNLASLFHPLGTSVMAPQSLGGVVDNELRVYGTQNVRVVDMSIAPLQLAAHLVDTAYAIGERAAHLIKASRDATEQ